MRRVAGSPTRARALAAVIASVLFVGVFVAWVSLNIGGPRATLVFDDVSSTVVPLLVGVLCVIRARAFADRTRGAWTLIGAAVVAWGVGGLVWTVHEVFLDRPVPFPSLADAGYLGMIPLAVAGMMLFPGSAPNASARARTILDSAIVTLSLLFVSWALLLQRVYAQGAGSLSARVIGLSYPAGDVVLLAMVVMLAARARKLSLPLLLLAAGFAALAVSDSDFAYLTTFSSYGASQLIDTGWLVGFILIGFGAMAGQVPDRADPEERPSWLRSALPYVALPVVFVIFLAREISPAPRDVVLLIIGILVLVALLARQFVMMRENLSLAQQMERLVAKRTDQLMSSEQLSRSILETANDAFLSIDDGGKISEWNCRAEGLFAWPRGEVLGRPFTEIIASRAEPAGARALERFVLQGTREAAGRHLELVLLDRSGREFDAEVASWAVRVGPTSRFNLFVRDVSERRRFERQLEHQALHDPLTGFANRALFIDRVSHALSRRRSAASVVILFIDIDDFKNVNDSLGHAAGDKLLIAISSRLRSRLRPEDTIARLGGDEFGVLLEGVDPKGAREVADRIMHAFSTPFRVLQRDIFAGTSVGIAVAAPGDSDAHSLLADADIAMYAAKAAGKARYEMFRTSMRVAAVQRMELDNDLRTAIQRDELRLLYQPIVDLGSGSIVGAEALLRWQHPARGLLAPEQFLALAEETGFIVPIGRWVIEKACKHAADWCALAPGFSVSVNMSPRQFRESGALEAVSTALARAGLEPASLIIEITESMMLDEPDEASRALEEIRALGVRIAIDDFGTGYSSLGRLGRLPVDILKIDRSFVTDVDRGAEGSAVARAIVRLAEIMNLKVTAEGIETAAQEASLLSMGCTHGQGFRYGRPVSPDDLLDLIVSGCGSSLVRVAAS